MVLTQQLSSASAFLDGGAAETCNRADSAACERIESRSLHFIDVVAIPRIADVATALVQRAAGSIEKAGELDV